MWAPFSNFEKGPGVPSLNFQGVGVSLGPAFKPNVVPDLTFKL